MGERAFCHYCGPGYRYGDEGCRHRPPQLHEDELADVRAWNDLTARAERAETALRLIASNGCTTFTRMSCRDQYSGRYPVAKYGADRWCDQCIAQAGLDGDPRLAALDSTDPVEDAPMVDKITTTDLTIATALTNATAIPVDFDPAPDAPAPTRSGEETYACYRCGKPTAGFRCTECLDDATGARSDAGLPADGEERK